MRCMPTKEDIWSYVKEKYKIAEEGKKNVLETVNENCRVYKSRLKRKHYMAYETDEERWEHRPKTIPEKQFKEILEYWNSDVGKEIARLNTTNCQMHNDVHTLGPRSIARLRHELEVKNPNKISDSMIFQESRKRNPTRKYKTDGCKTKDNIEKMNGLQLQIEKGEKDRNLDPFAEVVGNERKGRPILQGKGLKISLKDKEKGGYILDEEFYENMKVKWIEEVMSTLVSRILSELQATHPHLNFKDKAECSNQATKEANLQNDDETHHSQQARLSLLLYIYCY